MDLAAAEQEYSTIRPRYERLGAIYTGVIGPILQRGGIPHLLSYRTKDVPNLIKKIITKKYTTFEQVTDRLGLRIIVQDLALIPKVVELIEPAFRIIERQDKSDDLTPERLGYRGVHLQLQLQADHHLEESEEDLRVLNGELQIRTAAQNVWNDSSHKYLYKPDIQPPPALARRLFRLMALMEIYDDEYSRTRSEVECLPGAEKWRLLRRLEEYFLPLALRNFSEELSLEVLENLGPILVTHYPEEGREFLTDFVTIHTDKLREIYNDYRDATGTALFVGQPESILIWALLEARPFDLSDVWVTRFPIEYLDRMGALWGTHVPH